MASPCHLLSNVLCTQASICGVALGTTSPAEWAEMGVEILIIHPIPDFSFKIFLKTNPQAAIVAGIESGWVNPVINKEYAMEEVGDHQCHIVATWSVNYPMAP